ncbi:hypothetical protein [uncultured Shewanella sp.]|uniref:hypothetical protein n=1 Tax=uncultured Shewanella sp. TaxID=173975 RepID=UPI00261E6C70|nr:hypothetical protein [uncultured Shewanella sp.]
MPPATYHKPMESCQEQIEWLTAKIFQLTEELRSIKAKSEDRWMTTMEASFHMKPKTACAIRQRVKSKTKPMPEGIVWKQEAKGHEILVNVKAFREYL